MSRCNSMMSSGQCRLAPLIPCVQDSSRLYDYCVKILFKLHSSLPPDTLIGHRDRFLKQFKVLREFYLVANNLQYFKHLIQIPLLPEVSNSNTEVEEIFCFAVFTLSTFSESSKFPNWSGITNLRHASSSSARRTRGGSDGWNTHRQHRYGFYQQGFGLKSTKRIDLSRTNNRWKVQPWNMNIRNAVRNWTDEVF